MIWPWQRSIELRIVAVVVGLLLGVLALVNVGMAYMLARAQLEETANHLQIQALVAAQTLQDPRASYAGELRTLEDDEDEHDEAEEHAGAGGESLLPRWAQSLSQSSGSRVLVSDLDGRLLAGEGDKPEVFELAAARKGQPSHRWTDSAIFASVPVFGRRGHPVGVVRLSVARSAASARSRAMSLALLMASLAALGLGAMAASGLSRRLVMPLKALEKSANEVARGNWTLELPTHGQDELASLSRAFAGMLRELRAMVERQRLFVSHASHELRTPLTRIKLRTEALVNGALSEPAVAERFVRELDEEADRLGHLTNTLLDLSRLEERATTGCAGPLRVIEEAVERTRPLALARNIELSAELPATLPPLAMSAMALETVLDNLLDNAVKYTPPGGRVGLSARNLEDRIEIAVWDTGPGIPAEHRDHVFERFYRIDSGRGAEGFGLGLALVKAAVTGAGGEVTLRSTGDGGTEFLVTIKTD